MSEVLPYEAVDAFIQQIIDRTEKNEIQWYHTKTVYYQCEVAGAKMVVEEIHHSGSMQYRLRIEKNDCIIWEYVSNFSSKVTALFNYVRNQVKSANEPALKRIVDMIYKRNPVPIVSTLEVNREA